MAKKCSKIIPSSRNMNPTYARVHPDITGDSMTQQEHRDACDINHQIALFTRAGRPLPVFGQEIDPDAIQDLSLTYVDAINAVNDVNAAFEELPSAVRSRFNNSPLALAEFLSTSGNWQEAYDLGIVSRPPSVIPSPDGNKPPDKQGSDGSHAPASAAKKQAGASVPPDGGTHV